MRKYRETQHSSVNIEWLTHMPRCLAPDPLTKLTQTLQPSPAMVKYQTFKLRIYFQVQVGHLQGIVELL